MIMKYNKCNIDEFKTFLYCSCVHDSKIIDVKYNYGDDKMVVLLDNPYNKTIIDLTFMGVDIVLSIRGRENGRNDIVNSLTLEENVEYLHSYLTSYPLTQQESLYVLFQMFSETELHIVSKEILVQVTPVSDDAEFKRLKEVHINGDLSGINADSTVEKGYRVDISIDNQPISCTLQKIENGTVNDQCLCYFTIDSYESSGDELMQYSNLCVLIEKNNCNILKAWAK